MLSHAKQHVRLATKGKAEFLTFKEFTVQRRRKEEEDGMNWEVSRLGDWDRYRYTIDNMYKIDTLMGTCCISQGALLSALWSPKWKETKKRGVIGTGVADALCCPVETSNIKQLYSKKNLIFKTRRERSKEKKTARCHKDYSGEKLRVKWELLRPGTLKHQNAS